MTNLDSILKSRDVTLSIKVCPVKAMVFPVVMYGCESWTIKKAVATAAASVISNSVWPHRWQPTRLPHPWISPGKKTGVGCHFLLQCVKVKSESEVAQSCLTPSDPMDCSLPGSSIHGVFQATLLGNGLPLPSLKESWAPKNWCFWTMVLEKTLESPLDSKEIQPVHPKGD